MSMPLVATLSYPPALTETQKYHMNEINTITKTPPTTPAIMPMVAPDIPLLELSELVGTEPEDESLEEKLLWKEYEVHC